MIKIKDCVIDTERMEALDNISHRIKHVSCNSIPCGVDTCPFWIYGDKDLIPDINKPEVENIYKEIHKFTGDCIKNESIASFFPYHYVTSHISITRRGVMKEILPEELFNQIEWVYE